MQTYEGPILILHRGLICAQLPSSQGRQCNTNLSGDLQPAIKSFEVCFQTNAFPATSINAEGKKNYTSVKGFTNGNP
jgi:hypothetical protein